MEDRIDEFAELFGRLARITIETRESREPEFRVLLREHLGTDPTELKVVSESLPLWDHANLQLALEALAADARSATLVGIGGGNKRFMPLSLSDLVNEHHFRPSRTSSRERSRRRRSRCCLRRCPSADPVQATLDPR